MSQMPNPFSPVTVPAAGKRAGIVESMVIKLFTRQAHVESVEMINPKFLIVTLQGDALKDVKWIPGDKIQIQFGGWMQRTYTPFDWDAVAGRSRILVYLHGDTPGVQWARSLRSTSAGIEGITFLFELSTPAESLHVLDHLLGLPQAHHCVRNDGAADFSELTIKMQALVAAHRPACFVLTGRSAAVQQLHRVLKKNGALRSQLQTKAYWAPGKTGLD